MNRQVWLNRMQAGGEELNEQNNWLFPRFFFVLIFQFRSIGILIYYLRFSKVESA